MERNDLKRNPFFLDNAAIDWVESTLSSMSEDEKIGQIFCIAGTCDTDPDMKHAIDDIGVGGMMTVPGPASEVQKFIHFAQSRSRIPMLFAANLESGGTGLIREGTEYGNNALLAAGGNLDAGYRLGKICCEEAEIIGANWCFAPVVDLDLNWRNPATHFRSFGDDPNRIIAMASGYMRAASEHNMAVAVKHFPGDGADDVDHHYQPSINPLSFEQWEQSYGKIYRTLFDRGALTLMAGHIALPSFSKQIDAQSDPYAPATLSPILLQKLLREHMRFNGMVVTDSTNMLAFTTYMSRREAVPASIAAGCDMFLFNKGVDEDVEYLRQGVHRGIVSRERLDEAVMRILAVKAALGLNKRQNDGTLLPDTANLSRLGQNSSFKAWTKEAAERSITLVKDTQNMLPLTPDRYPRIYLNVLQETDNPDTPLRQELKAALEKEGFTVDLRDRTQNNDYRSSLAENNLGVAALTDRYDAAVYVASYPWGDDLAMHLSWRGFHARGNDSPWFTKELPTMFISLAHPYYLSDVPMIQTYINTYGKNAYTLDALMNRITGRTPFTGTSPADTFCGRPEATR